MATSSNTFKIIRDPNRPLQIDRAAYAQVMHLLREAEDLFQIVEANDMDWDTQQRALGALQQAIDALRTEAEAHNG